MGNTTDTASGTAVPLLLNFREVLLGNGLVVEVHAVNGRALSVQEADGCWICGVNPGGMAAFGDDASAARREFRAAFSGILREIATECDSFDSFARATKAFFSDTNRPNEQAWLDAVEVVRAGKIPVEDLERLPADGALKVTIRVMPVEAIQPKDNQADLHLDLAA